MRLKKIAALIGGCVFTVCFISMYLIMEQTESRNSGDDQGVNELESKIRLLEDELKANKKLIESLSERLSVDFEAGSPWNPKQLTLGKSDVGVLSDDTLAQPNIADNQQLVLRSYYNIDLHNWTRSVANIQHTDCNFADERTRHSDDVQIINVYDLLPFNNADGGVWKQGFDINYNANQWKERKLKVFVVPHSHNDPGWLKTYDNYFKDSTKHILDNMVHKLSEDQNRKLIWAEISYLSTWWNKITDQTKDNVKQLIKAGQLEIVTGGWVMNDEANTHYYAMIDQLIEGHQWLENNLGVKPVSGWAIDPFGHSSTMAYILRRMGMDNMLIQRVHYAVKKHFAAEKLLEFIWRQNWDQGSSTDMFCHMMPFYSYDVPHTCGPDPKICCQFDFKRLPGGKVTCPWKISPKEITSQNVAERAHTLLDQYRKKSQLYRTDVVLAPLGDDFRYEKIDEWDNQFRNYKKLMDYMNGHTELNVEIQFGTLTDYFNAVRQRTGLLTNEEDHNNHIPNNLPVVSGDFFTYADRDEHYWSGYYTSRPFQKNLNRALESRLRAAELIYSISLSLAKRENKDVPVIKSYYSQLVQARRDLGLFQHHDGITGTARDTVVQDYGKRLLASLNTANSIINLAATYLLVNSDTKPLLQLDEKRASHSALPASAILTISQKSARPVVFYNSLGHDRKQLVRFVVSHPLVEVYNETGHTVPCQVAPVWFDTQSLAHTEFQVWCFVHIPALSVVRYTVKEAGPDSKVAAVPSKITYYNIEPPTETHSDVFELTKADPDSHPVLKSDSMILTFSSRGLLNSVVSKLQNIQTKVDLRFVEYGTTPGKQDKSGAYLFLPSGAAAEVRVASNQGFYTISGPLVSQATLQLDNIQHTVSLYNTVGVDATAIEISNIVDIRGKNNREIAMRINTDIENRDRMFYTDLNGFQMQRRKTMEKLPLQANYYPMPTMAFMEDSTIRLTLHSAQPLGVAALKQGQIEVMMDRRLIQDDNRGLGQGVTDNCKTPNTFWISVEKHQHDSIIADAPIGYPSLLGHLQSQYLNHPVLVLHSLLDNTVNIKPAYRPLISPLPCDMFMVNLRTVDNGDNIPSNTMLLLLHRLALQCGFNTAPVDCSTTDGKVNIGSLFRHMGLESVEETSLSMMYTHQSVDLSSDVTIQPMEIASFKLTLL